MMHENSIESFQIQKQFGLVATWREAVYMLFASRRGNFTDREVIDLLQAEDMNLVRPEISRLVCDGLLMEKGKVKCNKTGRKVRLCEWSGLPYSKRKTKTKGGE